MIGARYEEAAGGFARDDSEMLFYLRANALAKKGARILDLGAGRGEAAERATGFKRDLRTFAFSQSVLVGTDVDEIVLGNPFLAEARVMSRDGTLPFAGGEFDIVVSDWVLEHIEHPGQFAAEVHRVLKPGGWLCARTPNKWGYIAVASRLIPESMHVAILKRMQPNRKEIDTFPKFYRLNTRRDIKKYFGGDTWEDYSYNTVGVPSYHGGNAMLFNIIDWYQRAVPHGLGTFRFVFLQKKLRS